MRQLADRSDLKIHNRKTVYQAVRNSKNQTASCTQINRMTGISMATVTKITSYFEELGILQISGSKKEVVVGRRPTMFRFVPAAYYSAGLLYDGKYLLLVGLDLNGAVFYERDIRANSNIDVVINKDIPALIDEMIHEKKLMPERLLCIGFALPVAIDTSTHIVSRSAPLMRIEKGYDFSSHCTYLAHRYSCMVHIENDVNAAVLGEYIARGHGADNNLVLITLGNGVGGGILLDGKLYTGSQYAAGEVGSMVLGEASPITLESRLSPATLERMFDYDIFINHPKSALPEDTIIRVADYVARQILFAIYNISALLNVEEFVLGGFVIEALEPAVFKYINQYLEKDGMDKLNVKLTTAYTVSAQGAGVQACGKAMDRIMDEDYVLPHMQAL